MHGLDQLLYLMTAALGAIRLWLAVVLLERLPTHKSIMTVAALEFIVGHGSARLVPYDVKDNGK
jgi:hypothetical protein